MDLLVVLVAAITIIILVALLIRKRYSLWKEMGAAYDEAVFPYGSLKGVGKEEHMCGRMQKIYQRFKGSAPFVGIFVFLKPAALVLDLELAKNILIKDFHNFNDRGIFYNERDDPLSAHMFNIHGSKWRLLRTKLSPTFTSGKMKMMFPAVVDVAQRLEGKIKEISESGCEIDIKTLMARFTTDVIGSVAFGIECNSLNEVDSEFYRMGLRVFSDPRHNPGIDQLLGSFRSTAQMFGCKRFHDDISEFFMKVLTSTVNYRISNDEHRNDFMDLLIKLRKNESGDGLTFNELSAQAFVFFVAGFETSSSLLQFCLYELASNPEIQGKARSHIEEVLARHKEELTYEAMLDMPYIDQILNESLRLHPPISLLFRQSENDYTVPTTKFVIPKGTLMVIPAYSFQRDPEIYPNPEKFNPENCSEGKMKERPSVTFLPFGEGPRICIGARFGMMQARIGIVTALRNYRYTLSKKMDRPIRIFPGSIITSNEGGIWLKVEQITK